MNASKPAARRAINGISSGYSLPRPDCKSFPRPCWNVLSVVYSTREDTTSENVVQAAGGCGVRGFTIPVYHEMEGQFYGILTLQRVATLLNEPTQIEIRARNEEDREGFFEEVTWRGNEREESECKKVEKDEQQGGLKGARQRIVICRYE
ncbi:hypothetical protein K0M31_005363 [Melipona bicolor]|uniref:Uncharacterized protein n=1 Tax=Melipona bicolor TaxID=60889 RepID=A0AA40FUW0_9HYME|nr:hypothetical protein K0M31_005363 [Melipona bicolor]